MLPARIAVTFKTAALIDPVKDTVTGAIELSVVTAPTGNPDQARRLCELPPPGNLQRLRD